MISKNIIYKIKLSIVLISIGTMLFSCENDLSVVKSIKISDNTPLSSSYDVTMEYSDSGKVIMILKSPEINRFVNDDEYLEMPKGIEMIFFDSIGNVKSKLTANYAINYVKTKIMEAQNNVIASNADGTQLFTEQLIWNQNKHIIYTEKKVKVIDGGKVLFGNGLTADETFKNYEIENPTGSFDLETKTE